MLNELLKRVEKIYIACGPTDFRKQIYSLSQLVENEFELDPYNNSAFIFCNKRRDSIKVLCYDKNGFVLAQKKLLNTDKMRFSWPRNKGELGVITKEQLQWLLSGLQMFPKKYFKEYNIQQRNVSK